MKKKQPLSEAAIDARIVAQADDNQAWESWESVNPSRPISIRLSEKTVAALKSLAKLKHEKGYQTLLKKWIDERLHYEQRIVRSLLAVRS